MSTSGRCSQTLMKLRFLYPKSPLFRLEPFRLQQRAEKGRILFWCFDATQVLGEWAPAGFLWNACAGTEAVPRHRPSWRRFTTPCSPPGPTSASPTSACMPWNRCAWKNATAPGRLTSRTNTRPSKQPSTASSTWARTTSSAARRCCASSRPGYRNAWCR